MYHTMRRCHCKLFIGLSSLLLFVFLIDFRLPLSCQKFVYGDIRNFDGFNNVTGVNFDVIPPIFHLVRFNQTNFSVVDCLCLLSVLHRNPWASVWIHSQQAPDDDTFTSLAAKFPRLSHRPCKAPTHTFGHKISSVYHASDVFRIDVLTKYGGVYLDNDVFVLKSLSPLRKFEMVVGWPEFRE